MATTAQVNDPAVNKEAVYGTTRYTGVAADAQDPAQAFAGRLPYLTHVVRRHFPADRNSAILDLGCGSGALLFAAHQLGFTSLRGVDVSPSQVEAAQRLGLNYVSSDDLFKYIHKQTTASLDVVVAFDVLEHLTREELGRIVAEVHRVLRPGGRWLIHVPNGESPFVGRVLFGDLSHERAFTAQSLQQLLQPLGFGRVEAFEDRPVIHGFKSAIRWAGWNAVRTALNVYLAAESGLARGAILSQNVLAVAYRS